MLKVLGLASCQASLAAYGVMTTAVIRAAVDAKVEAVKADMKSFAAVDTEVMKGSVDKEQIANTPTIYLFAVGPSDDLKSGTPDRPYSIYQEFGTRKMAAQPFVRPAAEANKPFKIKL